MSVESPPQGNERALRDDEKALLAALLSARTEFQNLAKELQSAKVKDMSDGGMGGVEFAGVGPRSLGATLVEAECCDVDGVLIKIYLNADGKGNLYELDLWKTDFSSLKEYPRPELIKITSC